MSDLIKRSDAIQVIKDNNFGYDGDYTEVNGNGAIDDIMALPSAERKGEWIWSPRDTDGTVSGCCSNCSFSHLFTSGHTAQYNYCPNCGAKMKGADDE